MKFLRMPINSIEPQYSSLIPGMARLGKDDVVESSDALIAYFKTSPANRLDSQHICKGFIGKTVAQVESEFDATTVAVQIFRPVSNLDGYGGYGQPATVYPTTIATQPPKSKDILADVLQFLTGSTIKKFYKLPSLTSVHLDLFPIFYCDASRVPQYDKLKDCVIEQTDFASCPSTDYLKRLANLTGNVADGIEIALFSSKKWEHFTKPSDLITKAKKPIFAPKISFDSFGYATNAEPPEDKWRVIVLDSEELVKEGDLIIQAGEMTPTIEFMVSNKRGSCNFDTAPYITCCNPGWGNGSYIAGIVVQEVGSNCSIFRPYRGPKRNGSSRRMRPVEELPLP